MKKLLDNIFMDKFSWRGTTPCTGGHGPTIPPPGISIVEILTERYNNNESLSVSRKFQCNELKLGKAKLDLKFPKKCKQYDAIPPFLNFKLENRDLRNSIAYCQCQRRLLDEEIRIKQTRVRELTSLSTCLTSILVNLVSSLDFIHLKSLADPEISKKLV